MTSSVEAYVQTMAGKAGAVVRRSRRRPKVNKLLRVLADKKRILITTHEHPDPDALASAMGLSILLEPLLKGAAVIVSVKGQYGGGLNEAFSKQAQLKTIPWDDRALRSYDAIILVDVQPLFSYSPLPPDLPPTAVIDHHRARRRGPRCPFWDVRPDVGAASSIVFSYFMELEVTPSRDLAATLLYAIESDLAGAARTPGELDNIALSSLTLRADPARLYRMRYVDLPQSYYIVYAQALANAVYFDHAIVSFLGKINSLEEPAVMADFLLRFDKVDWSLVTAIHENKLVLSLRTSDTRLSAAEMMRRLLRKIGEGGGHRTKAGGVVPLENGSAAEIERVRKVLRRRYLRALKIAASRGQRLVMGN
jgi:nanoRNase/pAp phosphatase (c-di-AMP/oligoRNAs hydrolase)